MQWSVTGTHRAVARYERFRDRFRHVLRCDIYRYFPAIDHAILKRDLRRRIWNPSGADAPSSGPCGRDDHGDDA